MADARESYWRRHHERLRDLAKGERLDAVGNWRGPADPFFADVAHTIDELIDLVEYQLAEIAALRAEAVQGGSGASSVAGSYNEAVARHAKLDRWG